MAETLGVAAAQFPVPELADFEAFQALIEEWIGVAAASGARLAVLPEYGAMCLASLFAAEVRSDLAAQIDAMQALRSDYVELHARLARQRHLYIVAGSFPWRLDDGRYVNRAWVLAPNGRRGWQDKQIMTRFEREQWGIASGDGLRVFETDFGSFGINICYDSEFPLLARAQAEAGAQLILVPSCTDTAAGYHRVRVGCQARALENQCVVVQSPLVGEAPWSPAVDVNVGRAAFFGPPDYGFPDDGVLCHGTMNAEEWLFHEVDLRRVAQVRTSGQVFNHRHWSEQLPAGVALPTVERIPL